MIHNNLRMEFSRLCKHLDNILCTKGNQEKSKLLKSLFTNIKKNNYDVFLHIRLLLPDLDRERQAYRIKESKLVKILSKMLNLPKGRDSETLSQIFKVPASEMGDVIYSIIRKYIVTKGDATFTVNSMNAELDKIATRPNDSNLDSIILNIFKRLSSEGIKWFIQILLKNVKLGIGHDSVLNCFHEDGAEYYKSNHSLRKLCETLKDSSQRLHELVVSLFEPFSPMLSKRCDGGNFKKCFTDNKTFYVENKFDGERFQLHMKNGTTFKYFSRNGYDYTTHFGSSFSDGILTPLLKSVFKSNIQSLILDGEMMLWNKNAKAFGSKGLTYDVKNIKRTDKYQPCYCIFDILLLNDQVLTNKPLKERFKLLETVLNQQIQGTILISKKQEAHSLLDIVKMLNHSIDKNEEGIVVKEPLSIYKFGDRKNGWFKLKMDYFDDVIHDLDLIMMGGCYGTLQLVNTFFVGVKSAKNKYKVVGRISSGLNAEQMDILNEKFRLHGVKTNPQSLIFGRDTPEVYLKPENSCVLQIRASELVRATNNSFQAPYTLRFPRILRVRDDKPVDQCLTMEELLELTAQNKSVIKLNKRYLDLNELSSTKKAPRKKQKVDVVLISHSSAFGDFLNKKKFYVYSGTDSWPVENICTSIKRAGGVNIYDFDRKFDVLLTSKVDEKIKKLMKKHNYFHIVKVEWLRRVFERKELVDFKPEELLYFSRSFDNDLSTSMDVYGDSFTEPTTIEILKINFALMEEQEEELAVKNIVCPELKLEHKFSEFVAYFDCFEELNNSNSKQIYDCFLDKIEFLFHRGTVSDKIREGVNLIVLENINYDRMNIIRDFITNLGLYNVEILSRSFIYQK